MPETTFSHSGNLRGGYKLHSTNWNTDGDGIALGAQDQLELLSADLKNQIEWAENQAQPGGVAVMRPAVLGGIGVAGTITTNVPYHNLAQSRLIASLFGAETISAMGGSGTDMYDHLYTFADDSALLGSFAYGQRLECHDFEFTRVFGAVFTWETLAIPTAVWDLTAKREWTDGSQQNTLAGTIAALTFPTTQPTTRYPMFHSAVCEVRMNAQTGAALAVGDRIYPSGLSLSIKRTPSVHRTLQNAPYVDEPHSNGPIVVSGTLTFPSHKLAEHWTRISAGTKQKMTITFTGDAVGVDTYKWFVEIPGMRLMTDGLPVPSATSLLGYTIPFMAENVYSAPSGISATLPQLTISDPISGYHMSNAMS